MEVLQYRDNGELSDITIKIGEDEFKLHKFPLYIKSEFFKTNAHDKEVVELDDFPGGKPIFSLVADFCYGKPIDFTLGNIAALRNGAELLVMKGSGNLITVTEKYIEDILSSAKLSRSIAPIMEILIQCDVLGEESDKAKVGHQCFNAIVEIWQREPQSSRYGSSGGQYFGDNSVTDRLVNIPLRWMQELIKSCGDHEAKLKGLAEVVYKYLARTFTEADRLGKGKLKKSKKADGEEEEAVEEPAAASDTEEDGSDKKKAKAFNPGKAPGETLDAVLMPLPEATPLSDLITIDWIRRALEISEAYKCDCRERLLQLAGNVLHRFNNEELKQIPSGTLCEIIDNTIRNDKALPEVLTGVLDSYMCELAKKKNLSVDDFIKLVHCVPENYRINHDTLFDVLEQLLTSGEDIPDEKKKELLESVDLSRCHENTLQRALDKNLVPVRDLCQASILLAGRLREEKEDPPRAPKYTDEAIRPARAAYQSASRPASNYLTSYGANEAYDCYSPATPRNIKHHACKNTGSDAYPQRALSPWLLDSVTSPSSISQLNTPVHHYAPQQTTLPFYTSPTPSLLHYNPPSSHHLIRRLRTSQEIICQAQQRIDQRSIYDKKYPTSSCFHYNSHFYDEEGSFL